MVDKIIGKLNEQIAGKVSNQAPKGDNLSKFDEVLNKKQGNLGIEKLAESYLESSKPDEIKVVSADNIQIQFNDSELNTSTTIEGKGVSELFSAINNDMLSMDAAIEVLSSGDVKLTRSQMLAYQHAMGTTTIGIDLYSKLVQSISQNLNTLLQTNLG